MTKAPLPAAVMVILFAGCTMASWVDQDCDLLGTVSTLPAGDAFQMTCTYDTSSLNSDRKVQFYKNKVCLEHSNLYLDTGEFPEGNALPMTTNASHLNEYLEATGRYSVQETIKGDGSAEYTMTINGVDVEDLGTMGCQIIDVSGEPANYTERLIKATLEVEGPSADTHFYVSHFCNNPIYEDHPACAEANVSESVEISTGQEFAFHHDEPCKVDYKLQYRNEAPEKVELYIANDDGTVLVDLPTFDKPLSESVYVTTGNGPLINFTIFGTYLSMSFRPSYTYHRKEIISKVTQTVFPLETLTVVETLNVTFPPSEVTCTLRDEIGSTITVSITCKASANPYALATWLWIPFNSEEVINSTKYEIKTEIYEDLTESTLTIFNVTSQHYGDYLALFENIHGSETGVTTVDDAAIGSGGRITMSSASMVLSFVFLVFHHCAWNSH